MNPSYGELSAYSSILVNVVCTPKLEPGRLRTAIECLIHEERSKYDLWIYQYIGHIISALSLTLSLSLSLSLSVSVSLSLSLCLFLYLSLCLSLCLSLSLSLCLCLSLSSLLSVTAEIQRPILVLDQSSLYIEECYESIPVTYTLKLINRTHLSTHFHWVNESVRHHTIQLSSLCLVHDIK